MIDYAYSDLFYKDSVNKQWKIVAKKGEEVVGTFTNEDIQNDSINITESISSGDGLVFGRCESNCLTFVVHNVNGSLKECDLEVTVSLNGNEPFLMGTYKVKSDKPTADRYHRKVTAYDSLYEVNDKDVADWYKELTFPMTIKQFRDSLFTKLAIDQEEIELVNDDVSINKSLDSDVAINAGSLINSICEINGAFGQITRDNKFRYIILKEIVEGLYPAEDLYPSDELYPKEEIVDATINRNQYNSVEYEDYRVQAIDAVVILGEDNEIAVTTKVDAKNPYNIETNFLLYDLDKTVLNDVANRLFNIIGKITYIPARIECLCNPCIEVGDSLRFNTKEKIIFTFVMSRTMSGLQYLVDEYESTGEEYRDKDMNSISKQLARLAAKSQYDIDVNSARIGSLEADHVTVAQLTAAKADISNLYANEAIISGSLNAAIARIGSIEADYITAGQLEAVNAKFSNLNANNIKAGTVSTSRLDIDGIVDFLNTKSIVCTALGITSTYINVGSYTYRAKTITVGGESITVLAAV